MKGKKLITVNQSESRIQSLQFDWTVLLQTEYWKNLVHTCQTDIWSITQHGKYIT